jgi:IclR family transcriptional regulator, acetate operon repressor
MDRASHLPHSVQTVDRALHLLDLLAAAGGTSTISGLATTAGLSLPTTHRMLKCLVESGYLRQSTDRRYALAPRLIRLGEAALQRIGRESRPHLQHVARTTGATASLAMLTGDTVTQVHEVLPHRTVLTSAGSGQDVAPHCAAAGKVLLAHLPTQKAQQVLERGPLPKRTPLTRTDPADLLNHLDAVRKAGYAVDDEESEIGMRGFAVPIPGAPSPTALAVYGPSSGIPLPNAQCGAPDVIPVLLEAAARIGQLAPAPFP